MICWLRNLTYDDLNSELPQNPASIPSATSLAREWPAEALFSHNILIISGWWAGWQGFKTGTGGDDCYQGQCQILEALESVTWILLEVIHTCSLLAYCVRLSDSWLLITGVKQERHQNEVDNAWWYFIHDHMCIKVYIYNAYHYQIIKTPMYFPSVDTSVKILHWWS